MVGGGSGVGGEREPGTPGSAGRPAAAGDGQAEAGVGDHTAPDPHPQSAELASLDAVTLSALLGAGELTSVEVAEQLLARIDALDAAGPELRSVVEVAPDALDVAARLDAERRSGRTRSALHGVPVLVKDNIDTAGPLRTTAGSLVFGDCPPAMDATLVGALRDAGALVLGKTNLSEWANFRSARSSSGWSAAGGQTRNPHALDRSPGGSSAGSAAAVAARLAPLAVGTETDGSVICPAAACGTAGLKPTLGLVSRTGIVPVAPSQDTAGPFARTVADVALLLEVLARAVDDGEDPRATTAARPHGHTAVYRSLLGDGALSGLRVGVVREDGYAGYHAATDAVLGSVLGLLSASGAEVVDPVSGLGDQARVTEHRPTVLMREFGVALPAYLARRAARSPECAHLPRSLSDVLEHARSEPRERADLFDLDLIEGAAASVDPASAVDAAAFGDYRRAARDGLDSLFGGQRLDVLALPAMAPAWRIDHVLGDHFLGAGWSPSAISGYPSATIPMGSVDVLPVGILLLGPPWSEGVLLRVMASLERGLGPAVTQPSPGFVTSSGIAR
jgi:amidase